MFYASNRYLDEKICISILNMIYISYNNYSLNQVLISFWRRKEMHCGEQGRETGGWRGEKRKKKGKEEKKGAVSAEQAEHPP